MKAAAVNAPQSCAVLRAQNGSTAVSAIIVVQAGEAWCGKCSPGAGDVP